jgi:D-3-phosphoglycerate dehydrogenase/microcystin synthetase protein McyI
MPSLNRPKVLLIGSMYHRAGPDLLEAHTDIETLKAPTPEAILAGIETASAVWVRYPTRLTGEAIRRGDRLLVISTSGRGTDAIDIEAATSHAVAVVNNPGLGTVPVSEHTLALMLDLVKQVSPSHSLFLRGEGWSDAGRRPRVELEGRTLGIIGLGEIGREVARKCVAAFRMRVIAYDPYVIPETAAAAGATWTADLPGLLREADVVSVHAELNAETRGMIGERELRLMRSHAYLINTARGPIVQQAPLLRALQEGWIAGAALDVFDPEPPPQDTPLREAKNLILTPHVAGVTSDAVHKLALSAAGQIIAVLRGERPPHLVNPQVWDRVQERLQLTAER